MLLEDREITAQAAKIEALLGEIEALPDPAMRARVADIVQSLLSLYGEGLARIVQIVARQGDGMASAGSMSAGTIAAFTEDDLISHLLLLHDLHPVDVETRVARALEATRPYLQSHGGDVELMGVTEGVAHLRLQGHCNGCPSSTATLKLAIEEAIHRSAPDLIGIEAEGVVEQSPQRPAAFVPISTLQVLEKR
jgi:Fe-S cluster biogenesis protein NfuA